MNGYEQVVTFIMAAVRQTWRNLEEVELVEERWRKKLVEAGALPCRPHDMYFRLRHILDKTCFAVKYDRKVSERSAFTIYAPLKCFTDDFSALNHLRSIIVERAPGLLAARSKGIEYEAEFLQIELLRELHKRNFNIPDNLLRYTSLIHELIQQQKGKLILDNSDEFDGASDILVGAQLKPVINKKEVWKYESLKIPSKIDRLHRKQCRPKTAEEAHRKLKLFVAYKMLVSTENSSIEIPDEMFPEHKEDQVVDENVMICQIFKAVSPGATNYEFQNVVVKLGNNSYAFKACKVRLSRSSHSLE